MDVVVSKFLFTLFSVVYVLVRMLLLIDGGCNLKEMMMIIVVNFVLDGISTSSCFSAPNRNLLLFLLLARFHIGNQR